MAVIFYEKDTGGVSRIVFDDVLGNDQLLFQHRPLPNEKFIFLNVKPEPTPAALSDIQRQVSEITGLVP